MFVDELPLALPASLRPVTFWVQSLAIGPLGITTGDAWRVDAF